MCRTAPGGARFAPLYLHSFRLSAARCLTRNGPASASGDYEGLQTPAQRLAWLRTRAGLLQREAAERAGVSPSVYHAMETGAAARWQRGAVDRLAALFGVPPTDLLDDYNRLLYQGQGRTLRAFRLREGLSQAALARQLGVPPSLVGAWERERKTVSRASFDRYWAARLDPVFTGADCHRNGPAGS